MRAFFDHFLRASKDVLNAITKALINEDSRDISVTAGPGLITLLDLALYRANEGELTATISSANDLLNVIFEIKRAAHTLSKGAHDFERDLWNSPDNEDVGKDSLTHTEREELEWAVESTLRFAYLAIESCNSAIDSITTDCLSKSANLSGSRSESLLTLSNPVGLDAGIEDNVSESRSSKTAMRILIDEFSRNFISSNINIKRMAQEAVSVKLDSESSPKTQMDLSGLDAWETPRLICPDYVWATEVISVCSRSVRILSKHQCVLSFANFTAASGYNCWSKFPSSVYRTMELLVKLLKPELVDSLEIFKASVESNAVVSRRLHVVKYEYRAPFRAFLEAHEKMLASPSTDLIKTYLKLHGEQNPKAPTTTPRDLKLKRNSLETSLRELMHNIRFVEAIELEHRCELLELAMAEMIFPFTELARFIEAKKVRLMHYKVHVDDATSFYSLLRNLRVLFVNSEPTVAEIQPLLVDLQETLKITKHGGEKNPESIDDADSTKLDHFLRRVNYLLDLTKVKGGFQLPDKNNSEVLTSLLRTCTCTWDPEIFKAQFQDWCDYVNVQHEIVQNDEFEEFSENMQQTEMELGLALASKSSLEMLKMRLGIMERDRQSRFELLQEVVQDVSLRELGCKITLTPLRPESILELPYSSVLGVFGQKLVTEGLSMPIG